MGKELDMAMDDETGEDNDAFESGFDGAMPQDPEQGHAVAVTEHLGDEGEDKGPMLGDEEHLADQLAMQQESDDAEEGQSADIDDSDSSLDGSDGGGNGGAGDDDDNGLPESAVTMEQLQAELAEMGQRLRKSEGHMGRMQQEFQAAGAAAAAASAGNAPTQAQLGAIDLTDIEELNQLEEEFPEFAATLKAVIGKMSMGAAPAAAPGAADLPDTPKPMTAQEIASISAQAAVDALIEDAHTGWVDTINTPMFSVWMNGQPKEIKDLGASERSSDAIAMLDKFEQFNGWVKRQGDKADKYTDAALLEIYMQGGVSSNSAKRNSSAKSRNDRLSGSVPATNSSSRTQQDNSSDTVNDAFETGFKSAR